MSTFVSLWIAAPILGTTVIAQWALLRTKHRSELNRVRARHMEQQHAVGRSIEQWKRQIGQLQHELAAARLQVKQLSTGRASRQPVDSRVREALDEMLKDSDASRRPLPADGFAETQPLPHSQHDIDLLLR